MADVVKGDSFYNEFRGFDSARVKIRPSPPT